MFDEIIDVMKSSMDKAIESLTKDLQRVRTDERTLLCWIPFESITMEQRHP